LKTAEENESTSLESDFVPPSECFGSENQYFAMDLLSMQQSPDSGVGLDLAEIDAEEDTSPMLSDVMMTGGQPFYSELSYTTTNTPSLVDDHHINLDINMLTDEDLFMMDSLADDTEQQQEVNHIIDKLPISNNEDVLNIKYEPEVNVDEEINERLSPTLSIPAAKDCHDPDYLPDVITNKRTVSNQNIHSYSSAAAPRRNKKKITPEIALRKIQGASTKMTNKKQRKLKKIKLYEVEAPLANPEAEKCRLNAINAKKNRERKKAQLEIAQRQIHELRSENRALREEATSVREDLDSALQEIQQLKSLMKLAGLPVDDPEE